MAEDTKRDVVLKSHVQDPATFQSFLLGEHEMDEAQAYRLASVYPELVEIKDAAEESEPVAEEAVGDSGNEAADDSDEEVTPEQVDPAAVFGDSANEGGGDRNW